MKEYLNNLNNEEWEPGICGICPYNCEVLVKKENGKIVDVKADTNAPEGSLCPRGKSAPEIIYSENRIQHPLVRSGPKGSGKFRRASWDEALEIAAKGFQACKENYGAQSLASYSGASSLEDALSDFADDFFAYYGSPNDMSSGSICFVPSRVIGPQLSLGLYGYELKADFENSRVIFVWGSNPATDSGKSNFPKLVKAQKKGAKIVLIDPRKNRIAEIADYWVRVKPGTDGALILALTKRILEENEYDIEFADKYVEGLEEYKEALKKYSYEELLRQCGITKCTFEKLYSLFIMSCASSFLSYTGLEYQPSGIQCIRMLHILWEISGKIDVKGGMLIRGTAKQSFKEAEKKKIMPIGSEKFPVFYAFTERGQFSEFPRTVIEEKPYPIRGLLIYGASPILSYPGYSLWKKAYEKLDMMVVIERSWSEDCKWADVILPATTYYENLSYCYYPGRVRIRKRMIEPIGESKNDIIILHDLAERLGFGEKFPKDEAEVLQKAFENEPGKLERLQESEYGDAGADRPVVYKKYEKGLLRKDGKAGFPTESGKVEIKSQLLEKYGYPGIPEYTAPHVDEEYPYLLMTGARSMYRYNSYGPSYKKLQSKYDVPCVEMNENLAKELDVAEGEKVIVETRHGKLRISVAIREMADKTVHIAVGGGSSYHLPPWRDVNANALCDLYQRDEISGFIICKSVGCNIKKEREKTNEKEIT